MVKEVKFSMTLGSELKNLRKMKGLTLRQVEEISGVSNGYLNLLENDKVKEPSPKILSKLAQAYDVPHKQLMILAGYLTLDEGRRVTRLPVGGHGLSGIVLKTIDDLTDEELQQVKDYIKYLKFKRAEKEKG
jgi:transcriptional regulator with XRE-family HTH domain